MYYVTSTDGIKLAVEDLNPTDSKVILFVHGWPISKEMFEYQKEKFVALGYRVISFDLRGFGDSQTASTGYHYDQLATDLYCIIESLNIDTLTLLGFSMGGAIATHYMSKFHNHKVSKLILVGAAVPSFTITPQNPYGMTKDQVQQLIIQASKDRPQMITEFGNKVFALSHSSAFKNWFHHLCLKASGIGTIQTALSLRDENIFQDLRNIHVPTYILHGKLDQICPFEFALIMNEQIQHSKLYSFEYSGHGLFYDELEKFNQILSQILSY